MPGWFVSRLPGSLSQLADRGVARVEPTNPAEAGIAEASTCPDCGLRLAAAYSRRSTVDPRTVGDR